MKLILTTIFCATLLCTTFAQYINLDFETASPSAPTQCGDTWMEDGITMQILPKESICHLDEYAWTGNGIWMYPSTIQGDIATLGSITSIVFEVYDNCGIDCTKAQVLDIDGNVIWSSSNGPSNSGLEILTFENTANQNAATFNVSSSEGFLRNITINYKLADVDCKMAVETGDLCIEDSEFGVVLYSPNGNCFRIKVDDNGNLRTQAINCP